MEQNSDNARAVRRADGSVLCLRAAILDLDGTLLDSMPLWETLGERYLRSKGRQPQPGLRADLAPLTMADTARYLMRRYALQGPQERIVDEINAMAADFYRHAAPEKPGAADLLRALRADGARLCVATATDRPLAEAALERLGMRGLLDGLVTCSEVGAAKDRPDVYFAALDALGARREETLVFEDALHAILTAKDAGFCVAAVEDASMARCRARIRDAADLYLRDPRDWLARA